MSLILIILLVLLLAGGGFGYFMPLGAERIVQEHAHFLFIFDYQNACRLCSVSWRQRGGHGRRRRFVKRQNYLETSSFSRRTGNVDVAAMILDDAV